MDKDPQELMRGARTIADKVRRLHAAGYSRSQIAKLVDRSYQQVRQVLMEDERRAARFPGGGMEEPKPAEYDPGPMAEAAVRIGNIFRMRVGPDGLVRLPQEVLDSFGLKPGNIAVAVLEKEGEQLTFLSVREGIRRAREHIPPWREGEPLWSDELIAERRREADAE